MKSIYKKTILSFGIAASGFFALGQAFGQAPCDSTCGNGAGNWRAVVPLYAQERETPVVNNITQVTQTIQPDTYVASGGGSGYNAAAASADCGGGGVMLSGGGSCENGQGLVAVASSQPNGNGWYLVCGAGFQDGPVNATAYAVCSRR
jgi:hypothetical protein